MSDSTQTHASGSAQEPGPKRRNWLKIALGVSLALNMLVVGFAVGAAWRFHAGGFGPRGMHHLTERLSEPARTNVQRILDSKREGRRAFRERMRAARDEARDAMLTEPFDKPRFTRAKDNLLRTIQDGMDARFAMLPDIAAELSLEERRQLLRVLRRSGRRMRRSFGP
jgi:uncharacterized membrane protein